MFIYGKDAIQKIIVEDDMVKTPELEWIREDPHIANLISERDKAKYKQLVRMDVRSASHL